MSRNTSGRIGFQLAWVAATLGLAGCPHTERKAPAPAPAPRQTAAAPRPAPRPTPDAEPAGPPGAGAAEAVPDVVPAPVSPAPAHSPSGAVAAASAPAGPGAAAGVPSAPGAAATVFAASGENGDTSAAAAPALAPGAAAARVAALIAQGTPEAFIEAVRTLNLLPPGAERREAITAAAAPGNPEAAALLFETLRVAGDPDLVFAVQQALGHMGKPDVLWEAVARYRAAADALERSRMLGVLRHTGGAEEVAPLIAVADTAEGNYNDPLALAAVDTLGIIGTPEAVGNLFDRMSAAAAGGADTAPLSAALARVLSPAALPALTAMAGGEVANAPMVSRVAATQALGNYGQAAVEPTLTRLLVTESDPALRAAAQQALARARGSYPQDFASP